MNEDDIANNEGTTKSVTGRKSVSDTGSLTFIEDKPCTDGDGNGNGNASASSSPPPTTTTMNEDGAHQTILNDTCCTRCCDCCIDKCLPPCLVICFGIFCCGFCTNKPLPMM